MTLTLANLPFNPAAKPPSTSTDIPAPLFATEPQSVACACSYLQIRCRPDQLCIIGYPRKNVAIHQKVLANPSHLLRDSGSRRGSVVKILYLILSSRSSSSTLLSMSFLGSAGLSSVGQVLEALEGTFSSFRSGLPTSASCLSPEGAQEVILVVKGSASLKKRMNLGHSPDDFWISKGNSSLALFDSSL